MKCHTVVKHIPNALSCCRIVLSPLLLLSLDAKIVFLLLYSACALTDFADGFIARKYKSTTAIGAKLDSFADFIFTVSVLYAMYSEFQVKIALFMPVALISVSFIFVVRIVNVIITKIKFNQWNVIHSIANKSTGFALFLLVPVYFLFDVASVHGMFCLALLALLASLEETCMLIIFSEYDVNRKSIFCGIELLCRQKATSKQKHINDNKWCNADNPRKN